MGMIYKPLKTAHYFKTKTTTCNLEEDDVTLWYSGINHLAQNTGLKSFPKGNQAHTIQKEQNLDQ